MQHGNTTVCHFFSFHKKLAKGIQYLSFIRLTQEFLVQVCKPNLSLDERSDRTVFEKYRLISLSQNVAGLFQGQQNSTQQQLIRNKARLMVVELKKGQYIKIEVADRVYVKSGGCESVDGTKVCTIFGKQ